MFKNVHRVLAKLGKGMIYKRFLKKNYVSKLPKDIDVYITDESVKKYKNTCNKGKDSDAVAAKKILRDISLGKLVYTYMDCKIYRYFDINFYIVHRGNVDKVINIWRNKKQFPYVKVDRHMVEAWNLAHGLQVKPRKIDNTK